LVGIGGTGVFIGARVAEGNAVAVGGATVTEVVAAAVATTVTFDATTVNGVLVLCAEASPRATMFQTPGTAAFGTMVTK
jgi:hypothetical protein